MPPHAIGLDLRMHISHLGEVPDPALRPLAFFAHERGDARVMKRIAALQDQGRRVIGFTFHRVRDKVDVPPGWQNVHLGTTYNRRYLQRLCALAKAVGVLWANRERLGNCAVIYAVNLDNALLALLGGLMAGRRIPLVLELADIQPVMTGKGAVSQILRAIERRVLKRAALLVTTSPGFVRGYFLPVQNYAGEVFLLENKVYPSGLLPLAAERKPASETWVVGCFGALRCGKSLKLMHALALRLGGRVRFVLRGYPAGTIAKEFDGLLGDLPNFEFCGSYFYPDELGEIYGGVDFNWAFDMSDPDGNSDWLLPNRIYEGGCFGVPALGAKGTETARWIEERGLGWTFAEPLEDSLAGFFESLEVEEWRAVKRRCEAHPREEFTGELDYVRLDQWLRRIGGMDLLAEPGEPAS